MNYNELNPDWHEQRYKLVQSEKYSMDHWEPILTKVLKEYCEGKIVLDLGCGYGRYTTTIRKIAGWTIGADISKKWLAYAKNKNNINNIAIADAHSLPFKDAHFDVVTTLGLLESVDRDIVLNEINRVLKMDGIYIILTWNKYSGIRLIAKLFCMITRKDPYLSDISKEDMIIQLHSKGFETINCIMNDGLIWLPDCIDRHYGFKIYRSIETVFKPFGKNPFSNVMLFIAKKKPYEMNLRG